MAVIEIPSLAKAFRSSLKRELIIAGRNLSELANPWIFFLAIVVFIPLGISPDDRVLSVIAPGLSWIIALLAVLMSLEQMFQRDYESGCLEQVLLSGQSVYWMVVAKILAHWLLTGLPLTLMSPVIGLLLAMSPEGYGAMMLSLFLGTGTLSFVGAVGASLTVALRRGGLLISLIIIPFYIPVLIFGSDCVRTAVAGDDYSYQLAVLAAFWVAALVLAPLAAAGALRIGVRE
ncbi:MAG: heme exporter protein B [Flavobacteriales bacterium]